MSEICNQTPVYCCVCEHYLVCSHCDPLASVCDDCGRTFCSICCDIMVPLACGEKVEKRTFCHIYNEYCDVKT